MKSIKIYLLLSLTAIGFSAKSQSNFGLHFMREVPNSMETNPGFFPQCKFFIGYPLISDFNIDFRSGFGYKDFLTRGTDDSVRIDIKKIIDLGDNVRIALALNYVPIQFGFKVKSMYFGMGTGLKFVYKMKAPSSLIEYTESPDAPGTMDITGINFAGLEILQTTYVETYLFSVYQHEKFTIGTRLKYLQGIDNLTFKNVNLALRTGYDKSTVSTGMDMYSAGIPKISLDSTAKNSGESNGPDLSKPVEYFGKMGNPGYAIDLGGTYKLNDRVAFSASMIDLGMIQWRTGSYHYFSNPGDLSFEGVETNSLLTPDQGKLRAFQDTLLKMLNPSAENASYTTYLPTKIYVGGTYKLTPTNTLGATVFNEFGQMNAGAGFALSYYKNFGTVYNVGLNYSMIGNSYVNVGFANSLRIGGWQMFFVGDNFFSIFSPGDAKILTFRFGMNTVIGMGKPKNKGANPADYMKSKGPAPSYGLPAQTPPQEETLPPPTPDDIKPVAPQEPSNPGGGTMPSAPEKP